MNTDSSSPVDLALAEWPALLAEAGRVLGIDLSPDESGYLAVIVDAQCTLQLQCTEDGRQASLFCVIAELDDAALARIAPRLLAANYFWQATGGATLGHDPASGRLVLARALTIEPFLAQGSAQAAHRFVAELQAFADRAVAWQSQLPEWLEIASPADEDLAHAAAPRMLFDRA